MHSVVCSLIPLLWLGVVPPCSLRHSLLYYASAQWPATPTHTYTHTSLPPALAFSSQDKGSWRLACRDLIAKAHFTFPKPGLIHFGAPADRNLLLSPLFPCLCFLSLLILKRKKKLDKKWAVGAEEEASLIFLFKALTMYFTSVLRKDVPMLFSLNLLLTVSGPWVIPHSSANTFYSNTTQET